jgi:hypothetical protein
MTREQERSALVAAALACLVAACITACSTSQQAAGITPNVGATSPPLRFAYEGVDGRPVSSEAFANRITVIGFLTTYDVHSQAEARFLKLLERHHSPRLNVAALMLEAPENRPLVEAFVAKLDLPYPVAIADPATIAGEGPFSGLHHVPSVIVLDRAGREAWRRVGFVNEAVLEAAVRAVEASSPAPRETPPADGG